MGNIEFGVVLRQEKIDFKSIRETAELCDGLGYHSVWFYDHILGMGSMDSDILESWTLMSALSTITSRVRIGTLVLCNSFRHPSLLAKMASTLDNISDGRLEFAIGAGWFEPEYRAYGYPFPDTVTRIEQLREAVNVIKSMWTEERATFNGKYYRIEDAYCNPKPVQKPHPPITIGGSGEKYLLRVVAELADEWNCPATSAWEFDRKLRVLKDHCRAIGRDIGDIAISEQTVCVIAETKTELEEKLPKAKKRYGFFGDIEKTGIVGTPDECIERIRKKVEKGVGKFIVFFYDIMKPDILRFFAKEVMPAF
ncbi:MAG TPA: TIGR03560 family F420-dependent LLM class oxidoreductase [Thermodesulfobacteriota bacterium]|jgi:F420-dependent oxidoreductase-like protein|nr:TIGR03560 family F420-dependent LLM class oxidoreductase [Thermodesulfobacteriota bacterium]